MKFARFGFGLLLFLLMIVPMQVQGMTARLIIDNHELTGLPAPPVVIDGHTLVPARAVFEHMGGVVGWHAGHQQVTVFHGSDTLVLTIGENMANLNGRMVGMPIAPMMRDGATMIPLRFASEAFGFYVGWDNSRQAVIIHSPGNNAGTNGGGNNNDTSDNANNSTDASNDTEDNAGDSENITNGAYSDAAEDDDAHHHEDDSRWYDIQNEETLPLPGAVITPPSDTQTGLARNISTAPILTIPHPETTITHVQTPQEVGVAAYVIVASSAISQVEYFILPDNRLVVDIHNAVSQLPSEIAASPSTPVSVVRSAQHSNIPSVVRVVFHVIGDAEFSIGISADRQNVTVSFSDNTIHSIFTQSDAVSDTLFIQGDVLPAMSISTEGFPHYLTINIDNASMAADGGGFDFGVFASHFVAGERPDGTAYIYVFMHGDWPSFSLAHNNNAAVLMLHHGISGVWYDSVNQELRIARTFDMDIHFIQHIDDYLRYQYTLVLPPTADVLGRGELTILDGLINSVKISRENNGDVHLTFNTARVLSFSVHETPEEFVIQAHLPRDISPFVVVLDPGHGGGDPGANPAVIYGTLLERDLVLIVSHMVMQLLENHPYISVFMTRTDNTAVTLARRTEFANELGADLFISVHANSAVIGRTLNRNPNAHGIETWYNLGALEMAEGRAFDSRRLAEIMQRNKIQRTGAADRGTRYGANLVVLRETHMPSVLLELGFLTNAEETRLLESTAYQWLLAQAIHDGIIEAFNSSARSR